MSLPGGGGKQWRVKPKAAFVLRPDAADRIYGPAERAAVDQLVEVIGTATNWKPALAETEIILSGWGMPVMDEAFLAAAPKLRAVFYGAGSIRGFVTDAVWDRGIVITSSYAANAVPVAEFSLAMILLALKQTWACSYRIKREGRYPPRPALTGAYGATVGLISLGAVGRAVRERLRPFDLRVIVYDPFVSAAEAGKLGVTLVSLAEMFRQADVVSLHAPNLPATRGMITGAHLAAMKPGATFLNTARGAVVREAEMIAVLQQRPDLTAVLDVTDPEPPVAGSPLYTLPNVWLTPHIAGSQGNECRRMGQLAVDELRRYLNGEPLRWQITRAQAAVMA